MYHRILIPLDVSSKDTVILNHIRSLAKMTGAELVLIRVAEGFVARLQNQLNLEDSEEINKAKLYLDKKQAELSADGFKVTSFLIQGKEPAEAIAYLAEQEHCDLIAMATHGHRFWGDMILGSVAESLRHRTDIPILMIMAREVKKS